MNGALLLPLLTLRLPAPHAPSDEPIALRVVAPFDGSEIAALTRALAEHGTDLGLRATVVRIVELEPLDLAPDTLLLGYERGQLEKLAKEGALAPIGPPPAVTPFARESWTPAFATGPLAEAPLLDSFQALLAPALEGRVYLRRVTARSTEGLILAAVADELGWTSDDELARFVVASDATQTLLPATSSLEQLLATLPAGGATITPVRVAVAAARAGRAISYQAPREGWFAVELAAALTKGASPATARWFTARFDTALAPLVRATLELEPMTDLPSDAPAWQRSVAPARVDLDRAAGELVEPVRERLVRQFEGGADGGLPLDGDALEMLLDGLLLTVALAGIVWAAWSYKGRPASGGSA